MRIQQLWGIMRLVHDTLAIPPLFSANNTLEKICCMAINGTVQQVRQV